MMDYFENNKRKLSYDWNSNTDIPMARPDLSDFEVARQVRMLLRGQLDHENVCVLARDRIMALSKELHIAVEIIKEMTERVGHKITDTGSKREDIEGCRFEEKLYDFLDRYTD